MKRTGKRVGSILMAMAIVMALFTAWPMSALAAFDSYAIEGRETVYVKVVNADE